MYNIDVCVSIMHEKHEMQYVSWHTQRKQTIDRKALLFNPFNAELNPICYLLALLGAHHFLHVSRIRVNSLLTFHS
jgi:hypothetical protein